MEWLDAHIGSTDGALQEAPEVFKAIGMDSAVHIGDGVVDDLMPVLSCKPFIRVECIGINCGPFLNMLFDLGEKSLSFGARNNMSPNFSVTLQESENGSFVFMAGSSNLGAALGSVHVARLAADERFINFDFPAHLLKRTALHGKAEPVHHEPCRLLSDAEVAGDFATTDSILAVNQQPETSHPLVHPEWTVLKNSSDFHCELFLAALAEPDAASRDKRMLVRAATWASDLPIGPPQRYGKHETAPRIGKMGYRLLEPRWESGCVFHDYRLA